MCISSFARVETQEAIDITAVIHTRLGQGAGWVSKQAGSAYQGLWVVT